MLLLIVFVLLQVQSISLQVNYDWKCLFVKEVHLSISVHLLRLLTFILSFFKQLFSHNFDRFVIGRIIQLGCKCIRKKVGMCVTTKVVVLAKNYLFYNGCYFTGIHDLRTAQMLIIFTPDIFQFLRFFVNRFVVYGFAQVFCSFRGLGRHGTCFQNRVPIGMRQTNRYATELYSLPWVELCYKGDDATFSLDAMRPFSFPRSRFCDVTQCKSILKRGQGGSQWGLNVSLKRAKTDYGKPLGEKNLKFNR